jgi:hypothetical protein
MPCSAVINPAARRMSVVFPAPSGPTSAVSAPRRTSNDTLSSARVTTPLSLINVLWILSPVMTFALDPAVLTAVLARCLLCQKMVSRHWLADTLWQASRGGVRRTDP